VKHFQDQYAHGGFFLFMREPPLRKTWEYSNITQPLSEAERGMPGRSYQTKPGLPSGCQVNIKCFYAMSTCLGSHYRNINSLTLVIPGYLQRTVDNYSRVYLWLIPMIFRMVFPSCSICTVCIHIHARKIKSQK
jgi:hypothetical protein